MISTFPSLGRARISPFTGLGPPLVSPGFGGDPLLTIPGLSAWRRTSGLFQDVALTIPATGTDPVGGWDSNTGEVIGQATASLRFALSGGWIASDNVDDILSLTHVRTPEYTAIARIKLPAPGTGIGRLFGINFTLALLQGSGILTIINEAAGLDNTAAYVATTDQVATLRLVRESDTLVKMWLDGVLISTLSLAQAADAQGDIRLVLGQYAAFAYADRILTPDELSLVETTFASLDP